MPEFIRPDQPVCDPHHLAKQISEAIGKTVTCDIDKNKVIVHEDVVGREADVQQVVDAYVYDPDYGKPQQQRDDEKLLEAFESNPNPTSAQTAAAVKALWRRGRP